MIIALPSRHGIASTPLNLKSLARTPAKAQGGFLKNCSHSGDCRVSGLLNIKARQIAEMSTRLKTLQSNTDRLSGLCGILT